MKPSTIARPRSSRTVLPLLLVTLLALSVGCKDKSADDRGEAQQEEQQEEQQKVQPDDEKTDDNSETEGQRETPSDNAAVAVPGDEELDEMEPAPPNNRPEFIVGETTPRQVLKTYPNWKEWYEEAQPTEEGVEKLASLSKGGTVIVYFGTWCGDSRRELARFWKALGEAERVELKVDYVALNPDFEAGEVEIEDEEVMYVPTFVVKRDGEELGRIVESSPNGIENDLYDLLAGNADGIITKREDL